MKKQLIIFARLLSATDALDWYEPILHSNLYDNPWIYKDYALISFNHIWDDAFL